MWKGRLKAAGVLAGLVDEAEERWRDEEMGDWRLMK